MPCTCEGTAMGLLSSAQRRIRNHPKSSPALRPTYTGAEHASTPRLPYGAAFHGICNLRHPKWPWCHAFRGSQPAPMLFFQCASTSYEHRPLHKVVTPQGGGGCRYSTHQHDYNHDQVARWDWYFTANGEFCLGRSVAMPPNHCWQVPCVLPVRTSAAAPHYSDLVSMRSAYLCGAF